MAVETPVTHSPLRFERELRNYTNGLVIGEGSMSHAEIGIYHGPKQAKHYAAVVVFGEGDTAADRADFIVEACNNYERLQALNAELLAALKMAAVDIPMPSPDRHCHVGICHYGDCQRCLRAALVYAAIAAAEAK